MAQYLGEHIPGNPTIVPRNMEGAGSLRLANYLYAAAPHDGTAIGAISRGAAFDPLLNENGAQFDASKLLLDRQRQQRGQRLRRAAVIGHREASATC